MQERRLGRSDLRVSAIGLGCMGMSEFYGPSDEDMSIDTLHHAIDVGMNFWDTADMYGSGKNEKLLSRVLSERRDEVVLATKFGIVRGEDGSFGGLSGKPDYVRTACDASLKRLGVGYIDLYYQHRVDPLVPIEDTIGAMAELVAVGKVRYIGLSEASAATLRRAAKAHSITALQTEYSLWTRDVEEEILATCRELGIGFVAYSPLGRGFLSGKIKNPNDLPEDDWRRVGPRFQGDNFQKNLGILEHVEALAAEKKCTPAQLALAWVLARGADVVPIVGTRHPDRIDENAASLEVTLTAADLRRIDKLLPPGIARGTRYPKLGMKHIDG